MIELSEKQIIEFLHRNYTAVDGLWFLKVEDRYGFDTALDIDNDVWKILPKIQARMLKSMGKTGDSIESLRECFETKLHLERFTFQTEKSENGDFKIIISECPWHCAMLKVGREKLSNKVGIRICNTEYSTWACEFGGNIFFKMISRICGGDEHCVLSFFQKD